MILVDIILFGSAAIVAVLAVSIVIKVVCVVKEIRKK